MEKIWFHFAHFAEKDDIQPTELTPWIGWVYTFPDDRGNRYVGKLLSYAETLAKEAGMKNMNGEDSWVYVRHL